MVDVDVQFVVEPVALMATADTPWDPESISGALVGAGWRPYGSVSLPYPRRLEKSGFRLGILSGYDQAVLEVVLKEQYGDWESADYVRSVTEGYVDQITESRSVARRIIGLLADQFSVEVENFTLNEDDFSLVHIDAWKVGKAHLSIGVAHVDPDCTPIQISLYVTN